MHTLSRFARAGAAVLLLSLAACSGAPPPPSGAGDDPGRLFGRGLDEIRDFYIAPVSLRRVALSGAAGLSRLDGELRIDDGDFADRLTLGYGGQSVASYPLPARDDAARWGELIGRVVVAARQVSPPIAALPPARVEAAVFDGMTASIDRFSRYSGPAAARRDRAARNGYSGTATALPSVTMSLDGAIAVFRIAGFDRRTARRVAAGIERARRQTGGRLAGVVLDLRDNPGGLLDQAVSLADLFIAAGPIVATVGRHPLSYQYFIASGRVIAAQLPVAVLINGGSASAAEIVAAALQDAGRAVVIGSASYGKGTVQTVLPLPNKGELILTWARLLARSGYVLRHHGVVPTLCTARLPNDGGALAARLQQAAAVAFAAAPRPRAALDEHGWSVLRRLCPPEPSRPAIDLALALRVLASPTLYREALAALPAATQVAQAPSAAGGLTDPERALSSGQR